MYDTIIKGGQVVDGTGAAPFMADIAISGGKIVEIGEVTGPTSAIINADGALVTPGFVDIHTHYDGQFLWDNELEPSFSNGVTTAIAGNCGVGFAPAEEKNRKALIELMEGVEDIPGIVLDEGLDWKWRSFPDYLDRLAKCSFTMDVAVHLPHAPLRVFVMGERALSHEAATSDDIEQMAGLVREAMAAGAIGVSGSRILEHLSSTGDHVPGTFAEEQEMVSLARAMGESGHGVFQIVPLGAGGDTMGTPASWEERIDEHERIERLAQASGRPVTYLLHSYDHSPKEWRMLIESSEKANARGLNIVPQVAARGLGFLFGLDGLHMFVCKPSYRQIADLPRAERAKAMREPERRKSILEEDNLEPWDAWSTRALRMSERYTDLLQQFYVIDDRQDYEPDENARLDIIAAKTGRSMLAVLYDTISASDGRQVLANFLMNYVDGGLDSVHDMLEHPDTVSGLGDGGAHLGVICDAAMPTYHLSFWNRDRSRGPKLPIEKLVHKLTGKPAALYGLRDRGTIEVGKRADINVIDPEGVGTDMPEMVFDLPKGGGRLLQRGKGYLATMVGGTITRRDDVSTGARPGVLVRGAAA